jgi:hypothetical protein
MPRSDKELPSLPSNFAEAMAAFNACVVAASTMLAGSVALRINMTKAPDVGAVVAKLIGRVCECAAAEGDMPDPIMSACAKAGVIVALASARVKKLRCIGGLSFL